MHDLPKTAKEIFDYYSGGASKKFGQNYIFSQNINQKIVSFAGALEEKNIIEIGPGPGGLTLEILKQRPRKLTLIELDKQWVDVWNDLSKRFSLPIDIIQNDVLKIDLASLKSDIIISNLPYNISSQVLFNILPQSTKFSCLVLMFQKELADRICAIPKTKSYGKLSVIAQWKMHIQKMLTLSPGSFSPPPKVHSSVLKFIPKITDNLDFDAFNSFISTAFANRRKQVMKQLSQIYDKNDLISIFSCAGLSEAVRAEEISLEQFLSIFEELAAKK